MVEIALIIGIYSLLIFGLGLSGRLNDPMTYLFSMIFIIFIVYFLVKGTSKIFKNKYLWEFKKDKIGLFLVVILISSCLINLIGALGPELNFDSLWYHLTIPKIFLKENKIFFIKGGLFYYSLMPKLTEMLYLVSLKLSPLGILAKIIHFVFGVFCSAATFKLARRYLNVRHSLLAVVLFYTTLLVGWESTAANVDLARTFFEILSLFMFLKWAQGIENKKENKHSIDLIESAVLLGLGISTKLIAVVTLPILLILVYKISKSFRQVFVFLFFSLLIVSPWFIFSFFNSGNPFYPVFSGILDSSHKFVFNPIKYIIDFWVLLYKPQDPLSPVFLIFLPVIIWKIMKIKKREFGILGWYCGLALLFWLFTPRTGGSRFILPYLPGICLFIVWLFSLKNDFYFKALMILIIISAIINSGYRLMANKKYIPILLGKESREVFLINNLNFKEGDFFDINGEIKRITKENPVIIFGSHNLFYVDFNFGHASYVWQAELYNYAVTQNVKLPQEFMINSRLIYSNSLTDTNLYLIGNNK